MENIKENIEENTSIKDQELNIESVDESTSQLVGKAKKEKKAKKTPDGLLPLKTFFGGLLTGAVIAVAIFAVLSFISKENTILRLIHDKAITEATDEDIENGKYDGMLASLGDKYADYLTREETEEKDERTSGVYDGLGIMISADPESGLVMIPFVYEVSPAAEAGIEAGDVLVKVGDTEVNGLTTQEVLELIDSFPGEVPLTLERGTDTYQVNLTRGHVEVQKVFHEMLEDGIGYISIARYNDNTDEQFIAALDDLEEQGLQGLILDLRGNPGGFVNASVNALKRILPEGLAVYTVDKAGNRKDYKVKGKTPLEVPVVVLVDGSTASAAEIFAGACRDRLGAVLVGKTTFGKGIVQTTYGLSDGSSVKFTTSHYYTPDGVDINGTGLEPDIEVDLPEGDDEILARSEQDTQYAAALEEIEKLVAEKSDQAA